MPFAHKLLIILLIFFKSFSLCATAFGLILSAAHQQRHLATVFPRFDNSNKQGMSFVVTVSIGL